MSDEAEQTAPKAKPAATDRIKEAVQRGVDNHIATDLRNSDFSRDTPAWNHFQATLPALIESIVKEVKG